jgi:hypothetical protein
MIKTTLNVLVPVFGAKDNIGRPVVSYNIDSTTTDSFQSLKYNTKYNIFGVTDKTSNVLYSRDMALMARYFLPDTDPTQFNVTYRLGLNNNQYIINSILPYTHHMEIYCELVI